MKRAFGKQIKVQELIKEVDQQFRTGEFYNVPVLLKKIIKLGKPSTQTLIYVIERYADIGEFHRALKMLGNEIPPSELHAVSDEQLCTQFILAYVLCLIDSNYYGRRILGNFLQEYQKRKFDVLPIVPRFYVQYSRLYLNLYDFEKFEPVVLEGIKRYPKGSMTYNTCLVTYINFLFIENKFKQAKEWIDWMNSYLRPEQMVFKYRIDVFESEILVEQGRYQEAMAILEKVLVGPSPGPRIYRYYAFSVLLKMYIIEKNYAMAEEYLKRVRNLYVKKQKYDIEMAMLYYKEQIPTIKIPLADKIALRCHTTYTPYAFKVGRNQDGNDCWIISNGKIQGGHYASSIKKLFGREKLLDLYSGVCKGNEKANSIEFLGLTEVRYLQAVFGSGSAGINLWTLCEYVYRQQFYNPISGKERVQKYLARLNIFKLKVVRQDNVFFAPIPKGVTVILPMKLVDPNHMHFLSQFFQSFRRTDLEKFMNTSRATVNRWIKSWKNEGLILDDVNSEAGYIPVKNST